MAESSSNAVVSGSVGVKVDPELTKLVGATRRVLAKQGFGEVGNRALARLTARPAAPTVVVIGEISRGKSSLINAILGRPDAAPVSADICTSAFLRFEPPTDSQPEDTAHLIFAGGREQPVPLADLPAWITADGARVQDPAVVELPIGAARSVESPYLPGIILVDTPGAGGLNPRHLTLALSAADSASVLVLVCDSVAPLTLPELRFLREASREIDAVVIAVSKIDKNARNWRTVVAENRRLLAQHTPRFASAPIVAVSAAYAAKASGMPASDASSKIWEMSGIDELTKTLRAVLDTAGSAGPANALRTLRSGLEQAIAVKRQERSAVSGDPAALESMVRERARLDSLRERDQEWRDYLQRDLSTLQSDIAESLDVNLDLLQRQWKSRIEGERLAVVRRAPQLFVAEMTADIEVLRREVVADFVAGLTEVIRVLFEANSPEELGNLIADFDQGVLRAADVQARGKGVVDPQMVMLGVVGVNMLGPASAGALAMVGIAVPYLAIAVGAAWVAVNLGFKAIRSSRQSLLEWLAKTIAAVRTDLSRAVGRAIQDSRPEINSRYRKHIRVSMENLQRVIRQAEIAAKASAQERKDAMLEVDTVINRLQENLAGVDGQLARMAGQSQLAGQVQR